MSDRRVGLTPAVWWAQRLIGAVLLAGSTLLVICTPAGVYVCKAYLSASGDIANVAGCTLLDSSPAIAEEVRMHIMALNEGGMLTVRVQAYEALLKASYALVGMSVPWRVILAAGSGLAGIKAFLVRGPVNKPPNDDGET